MKTNSRVQGGVTSNKAAAQGLLGILDYAIAEGAELQRPVFVFLLKLARLALLESEGTTDRSISLVPMRNDH